jgi:hypothetical protein
MPNAECRFRIRVFHCRQRRFGLGFRLNMCPTRRFPEGYFKRKSQLKKVERIFKNRVDTQA